MAYTLTFALAVGTDYASSSLVGYFIDTSGATVSDPCTTGFLYVGGGYFMWTCSSIPDDFRGGVKIYDQSNLSEPLLFVSINPEEGEYIGKPGEFSVFAANSNAEFSTTRTDTTQNTINVVSGVRK